MFFIQENNKCGQSCVRNILKSVYSKKVACQPIENSCDSFYSIQQELKSKGIQVKGYKISDLKDLKKFKKGGIFLLNYSNSKHFVFFKRKILNFYLILFPEIGWKLVTKKFLLKIFTFNCLMITSIEKQGFKKVNLIKNNEKTSLFLLCFIETLALVFFVLLYSQERFQLFSLICLPLVLLVMFFHKISLVKITRSFDRRFSVRYLSMHPSKESLSKAMELKKSAINAINKYLNFFQVLAMFTAFCFLFEKRYTTVVLLSIFTLGLIDAIVKKRFSFINRKIVECESDMFAKEEFSHAAFEEADEKIASYVKLDSFATFLKGLISIAFSFFYAFLIERVDIYQIVLDAIFFYFISLNISKISLLNLEDPYSYISKFESDTFTIDELYS